MVSADAGEVLRRPADLRLFGMAAGMWGSSLLALYANAVAATWIAVAAGAGAVGLALALFGRPVPARRVAIGWAAAAVLLGVVCGAASTGARTVSRDADPLADLARRHALVRAELTVTDDPKALGQARPGPATFLVPARLTRLVVDGLGAVSLDARVVVFATDPAWRTLLPSQAVATTGRLAPARGGDLTAASLTTTDAPEPVNRPSWMQRAAARLRAGLQAACAPLSTDPGGLLPGLVIGDTSRLDPALAEDFRTTGLTHLVAVSGANLAIVLSVILFAARWCRAGPWLATAICAAALVGFVVLARPSPSVVRAAAMGAVGLLALASGRRGAAAPALATAVIVALLIDPALAVDVGFALSVSATGALVLLARPWRDGLRARGVPAGLADALAVPAAAQVACGPIIVALSGGVSLVAVPANLLAAPAVAPATLLGVASAIVSPLWPDGAGFLAWVASWPARWLVAIARTGAAVPIGTVPWPAGLPGALALALVTAAVLVAARRPVLRRVLVVIVLGVAVGAAPVRWAASGWPPEGAVIVACDVGQGDAIVLPLGQAEAIVVDTGPEPVAVDGCLRRLGVDSVPLLVLSHFHVDHIGGLSGVFRGRSVGALLVPAFGEPAEADRSVRAEAEAASVPVVVAAVGWTYARGDDQLRVIGPARRLTGTRSDPNNNSVLIRVVARGVSMLLVGDAETEEQEAALADDDNAQLRVDILKVAHHGSIYQDPDFLDAVHPIVGLVSVGTGNPYGHPNVGLLERLTRTGARVVRTDVDGDLAVVVASNGQLGVAVSGSTYGSQALLHTQSDATSTLGVRSWNMGVCPHDSLRCASARHRRRRTAGGARGFRSRRRGEGSRPRNDGRRVRSRRDDRRRSHGGGQPIAVRRHPGRGDPQLAGCQEGARGGIAGLCRRAGTGCRACGDPRRRCQGQGRGRRSARGRRHGDLRREDHQAPRAGRVRPGRDPSSRWQMRRRRGRGTPRRGG